jgi:2-polyprenyl-3-methyl-5-hydroxy-6-metoxy-1,4-benzoquinol methylase
MNKYSEIPNERFELIPCPVCSNQQLKLFMEVTYGDLKQKKSLDYSSIGITADTKLFVKRCKQCGFVFVNPRIKPEYQHMVYNECKKKMYELKPYLLSVGTIQHSVTARKGKLSHIKPLLATLSHINLEDENLTLFDYGCGFGYSMSLARELGLNVYGVDIDRERLSICEALGLQVADPSEFDSKYPDIKADIVLCQNNIEHIVDLPATMDFLKKKSKTGTILYVDGPTPRIISIEKKKGEFVKAHFVEHINFFPVKTLDYFMARYGFRPLPMTHMSIFKAPMDVFRSVRDYLRPKLSDFSLSRIIKTHLKGDRCLL